VAGETALSQWELLDQLEILNRFAGLVFGDISLIALGNKKLPPVKFLVSEAVTLGHRAGLSTKILEPLIAAYVKECVSEGHKRLQAAKTARASNISKSEPLRAESELRELIARCRTEITELLAKEPQGLEKALIALRHTANAESNSEALAVIGPIEKDQFKESIAELRRRLLEANHERHTGDFHQEAETSLLRYYEDFEPHDAKQLLRDVSKEIVSDAEQAVMAVPERKDSHGVPWDTFRILYLYWLYSRCRHLRYRLVPAASRFISHIESWQEPSGAWQRHIAPVEGQKSEVVEDPLLTALAVLFLSRYGEFTEHQRAITRAGAWLLSKGSKWDGWQRADTRRDTFDPLTTVLVLEALRRAGVPGDHPAITQAEEGLICGQHPTGFWLDTRRLPEELLTGVIVDYLRSRSARGGNLPNPFLVSGRALIARSENLALSSMTADARLAVIAAYHGLEHVLYGWLLVNGKDFYRGRDTVGFRDALTAFQQLGLEKGWILPGKGLPFKGQLGHLATSRDQIIHQAAQINADIAEEHVSNVRQFVRRFDQSVLGFPLLD